MIRSAQLLPQTLSLATLVFFAAADSSPAQSVTRGDSPQISRILFGSCAQQDRPLPILATIVKHKPELFIFMGDNIYADTRNMDVMRRKYETLRKQPGFLQLWRSCPVLATWDDHDYGVNDGGAEYEQKRESERLFLDFWGVSQDAPRRKYPGVYAAQTFGPAGKRVQVLLLDTRYFRGPLQKGNQRVGGSYVPTNDSSVPLLGQAQWKWLEQQLRAPAEVRILVSSIQCLAADAGQECWANLPHERRRLFQLIDRTEAEGLLIISGDRHWAELAAVTDEVPYPLYELTASSFNQLHPRGTPTANRNRADPRTYHRENFGSLTIDWTRSDPRLEFRILDLQGKTQIEKSLSLSELRR